MKLFTSYHPALIALNSLQKQFPAAESMHLFCRDEKVEVYRITNNDLELPEINTVSTSRTKQEVQKFRATTNKVMWCDFEDLPLKAKKKNFQQITIEDEIEQNVLVIRIQSMEDEHSDVFAIEFPKSLSNFYLHNGRNSMSSEFKKSIGNIVREQISWLYNFQSEQKENVSKIQKAYQNLSDQLKITQNELVNEKSQNETYLNKYISSIIAKSEEENNCVIKVTNDYLKQLKSLNIGIDTIKQTINDSIATAYDLAVDKSIIQLSPDFIFYKDTVQITNENISLRLVQLNKTMNLLDRYESGCRELQRNNQKINGKNLAKTLGISGPAITDAIKKHSSKIVKLISKHPEKWTLLCEHLKPVREIHWEILSKKNA